MIEGISPDLPHTHHLPRLPTTLLRLARRLAEWIIRSYWRVKVHGEELVPKGGPVILAVNHIAFLDGPLIVAMTDRISFALAKKELFQGRLGRLLHLVGQIDIDRSSVDKRAINRSIQVLRSGGVLAVFPEGARGTGEVNHAYGGAAYFAMVTGAPIVPVALLGTRSAGQSTRSVPRRRSPIHVVFGEPMLIEQSPWPRTRSAVTELTEQVRKYLACHVVEAQVRTGLPLPGPPKIFEGAQ